MPVRQTFGYVPDGSEILLYVVFAPFALAFILGLYRRLQGLRLGSLISQSPRGIGGAVRRLLVYAALQRRVVRRPRGWPHLAIFYGFLTLLFGTTVVAIDWDILRPLGIRLLVGSPYLYLEVLLDLLGLAFLIGLAAALVWRLGRLRKTGPDQRRMQWQFVGLIGALLYMGVTGFILEGLRLTMDPVPWSGWSFMGEQLAVLLSAAGVGQSASAIYTVLWWSHAVVAFCLIAAIPYTAFLHSLAAPLNLMVHPGRPRMALASPFDLRELQQSGNFDVKVGAATLADLEPAQRLALTACTNCGRCDDDCPALAAGTALSPRRLVQTLRDLALGGGTRTDLLDSGKVTAEEIWACTTCAACVEACPVFIRPVDYIVPIRRELVTRQRLDKRQSEFLSNLGRSLNPYGLGATQRQQLASRLEQEAQPTEQAGV